MRLAGKTALVTGAARGIGAAMAQAFAAEGARVWLTDVNGEAAAQTVASIGAPARSAVLDVRDETAWEQLIAEIVGTEGKLDVLVNNAGITGLEGGTTPQDPENASLEAWRVVHHINLDGVFLGCKHAIRAMRPRKAGSIINISSRSGIVGVPHAAAYASSKAAVRNHTKSVALYCAAQGLNIRCNSIHPGAIMTPMWDPMLGSGTDRSARESDLARSTPLGRFGYPSEVAALAVMLASDEATFMTGAELNIDGGILAGSIPGRD